jgi:hypothetical protein
MIGQCDKYIINCLLAYQFFSLFLEEECIHPSRILIHVTITTGSDALIAQTEAVALPLFVDIPI